MFLQMLFIEVLEQGVCSTFHFLFDYVHWPLSLRPNTSQSMCTRRRTKISRQRMSVLPSVSRLSELVNSSRIFPSWRCAPSPLHGKVWWVYIVLSWDEADQDYQNYTVPVPGGHRQLLNDIYGYVKPGSLTALMGASGAGKTTLLDVLASRKNIGVIEGDVLMNGRPIGTGKWFYSQPAGRILTGVKVSNEVVATLNSKTLTNGLQPFEKPSGTLPIFVNLNTFRNKRRMIMWRTLLNFLNSRSWLMRWLVSRATVSLLKVTSRCL